MTGLGTIINSVSIIAGGLVGHFTGKLFRVEQQEALNKACGVSVLFIGIAGAMEGMLSIDGGKISSGKSMLVVLCLAIGTIIGELIGIEHGFESFGEWLKQKTGNSKDAEFVNAFVTASLTVSIGAMAIVGSIQDGLLHRSQSDLGKESECGEYAAISAAGSSGGVSAVGILRLILHDMETAVC